LPNPQVLRTQANLISKIKLGRKGSAELILWSETSKNWYLTSELSILDVETTEFMESWKRRLVLKCAKKLRMAIFYNK
jgi:hypothetical protein